jgi:hypothetical protein
MKAVQIGILVALVVCAGLLFKIYRGQQSTPAPQVAAAALSTPAAAPAAVAPAPVAPAPAPVATPVAPEASKPVVAKRKPSPARRLREQAQDPVVVAQNQPPAEPPAAAPAPVAPPVEPQAQPAPAPAENLNPPSGTDTAPPPPHTVTIPAGTSVFVRLGETLSTDKNQAGDTFAATLDQPLVVDGFVIAERGARVRGAVMESEKAGRVSGVSSLAVHLTRLRTSDGQDVTIQTEAFRKQGPTSKGEDAKKVGVGAAIGAAIGAIAGGGKGAAIGAGVGGAAGAGTVAATRGKPTELPVETRVTFRLQQPLTITERIQ